MRQFGLFQTVPAPTTRGLDDDIHEYVDDFIFIKKSISLRFGTSPYILLMQTTEKGRVYGKSKRMEDDVGNESSVRSCT